MNASQRKRYTPREWRERQAAGVWITLPSGLDVRVGSVGPEVILKSGRVPDSLTPLVADMVTGRTAKAATPLTKDQLESQLDLMDAIVACFIKEPRIVDHPEQDDELAISDIEWVDKEFLMASVGQPLVAFERFRDQQALDVERVSTEPADEPPAE